MAPGEFRAKWVWLLRILVISCCGRWIVGSSSGMLEVIVRGFLVCGDGLHSLLG